MEPGKTAGRIRIGRATQPLSAAITMLVLCLAALRPPALLAQESSARQSAPQQKDGASKSAPQLQQSQQVQRTWGPEESGVRVDLTLDKLAYALGEDIPLHIAVENVSGTQLVFAEPFRPRPAFGDHAPKLQVIVLDDDGPIRPSPLFSIELPKSSGGPSLCPAAFPSGKPVEFEESLSKVRLLPARPGNYKIVVSWSPYTSPNASCDAVHGDFSSPMLEQPFVTVTSTPLNFTITDNDAGPAPDSSSIPEYTAWKSHFALVNTSFGEMTALLDNESNLEWLRLNFTAGVPYERVLKEQQTGGSFEGWRFATVEELHAFFARFTGTADGHSSDPAIERKLQRLLGGPLNDITDAETGWHRSDMAGFVGDPVGPDNNMIHYHMGYIGEDPGPTVLINADSGGSTVANSAPSGWGSFLVRKH